MVRQRATKAEETTSRRQTSYKTKKVLSKKPEAVLHGSRTTKQAPVKPALRYKIKQLFGGMHSDKGPLITDKGVRKHTQWEWAGPGDTKYIVVKKPPFNMTEKEAYELACYYGAIERRVPQDARTSVPGETVLGLAEGSKFWVEEQELSEDTD